MAETPPPSPWNGNPNDPTSYAPGPPAARQSASRPAPRRLPWVALASGGLVLATVVAVVVVGLVGGATGKEKTSQADADAALLPLSAMPAGTIQQGTVEIGGPPQCPLAGDHMPQVDTARTFAPPGGPELYEEIEVDARRGATALVDDARKQFACSSARTSDGRSFTVYALDAPHLTSGEIAYEIIGPDVDAYVIAAPINHSAAIAVVSVSHLGPPNVSTTVSFLEHAFSRARAKLDG